jgi:hypothetical protein
VFDWYKSIVREDIYEKNFLVDFTVSEWTKTADYLLNAYPKSNINLEDITILVNLKRESVTNFKEYGEKYFKNLEKHIIRRSKELGRLEED